MQPGSHRPATPDAPCDSEVESSAFASRTSFSRRNLRRTPLTRPAVRSCFRTRAASTAASTVACMRVSRVLDLMKRDRQQRAGFGRELLRTLEQLIQHCRQPVVPANGAEGDRADRRSVFRGVVHGERIVGGAAVERDAHQRAGRIGERFSAGRPLAPVQRGRRFVHWLNRVGGPRGGPCWRSRGHSQDVCRGAVLHGRPGDPCRTGRERHAPTPAGWSPAADRRVEPDSSISARAPQDAELLALVEGLGDGVGLKARTWRSISTARAVQSMRAFGLGQLGGVGDAGFGLRFGSG